MTSLRIVDEDHRVDAGTYAAGCRSCPLLTKCGGYTTSYAAWSCMDTCAECNKDSCDLVCLHKPERFNRDLMEVGGFDLVARVPFISLQELPHYVPVLQHTSLYEGVLDLPVAAVPLAQVVRADGDIPFDDRDDLRQQFGVGPRTKLLLLGTGKDRGLERYWRWRRANGLATRLHQLDFVGAVSPNFSLFLNEPRPTHLHNRKRSLICAEDWTTAGMPVAPYLGAVTPGDWDAWAGFLADHPEITAVAKEFQTGNANPRRGGKTLVALDRLQQRLGRRLHVIAVGAGQFARDLSLRFDRSTIVDSHPFMKALNRRAIKPGIQRIAEESAKGEDVRALFDHNIATWEEHLASRIVARSARG